MELTDYTREAAVLVITFQQDNEELLVLTQRTNEVAHHKGQISFPGGMKDDNDKTLWDTALREAYEEIGLKAGEIRFIKELTPRVTPTRFRVTPYVATIEMPPQWQPNPAEIAEIFTVPLSHLRAPENFRWVTREMQGVSYPDPCFTYQHYEIWGLTARVLCELLGIESQVQG